MKSPRLAVRPSCEAHCCLRHHTTEQNSTATDSNGNAETKILMNFMPSSFPGFVEMKLIKTRLGHRHDSPWSVIFLPRTVGEDAVNGVPCKHCLKRARMMFSAIALMQAVGVCTRVFRYKYLTSVSCTFVVRQNHSN